MNACATSVISVKMGYPEAHDSRMGNWPNESFHRIAYAPGELDVEAVEKVTFLKSTPSA